MMNIEVLDQKENKAIVRLLSNLDIKGKIEHIRDTFSFYEKVWIGQYTSEEVKEEFDVELPEWVVGTSCDYTIIIKRALLKETPDYIKSIIIHEFVHVVLNHITEYTCPLYIADGLAMYFAGQKEKAIDPKKLLDIEFDKIDYSYNEFYRISYNIVRKMIINTSEEDMINSVKKRMYSELQDEFKRKLNF